MSSTVARILQRCVDGRRLEPAEAVLLARSNQLIELGQAAKAVCKRLHPEPYRTYNIDRNINYTNICICGCHFCAFHRHEGDPDAYVISREELYRKVEETLELGGDQILLQGGLHPKLPFQWYEELLADLKARYPVHVHGFSPPELWHLHRLSRLPLERMLARLKAAGLGSIPGGGAEMLVDRVRQRISPKKCTSDQWLELMRTWHQIGGRSTATMMFGHVESVEDRIEHMERLRRLQDETGGFTAFIPWTFQNAGPQAQGTYFRMSEVPTVGAFEYLKTLALARLYLDNFPNIQCSWVTQGPKIAQLGLLFGANDMGSLMIEENVVASAGTRFRLSLEEIRHTIRETGYIPRQRNVFYEYIDEQPAEHEPAANQP